MKNKALIPPPKSRSRSFTLIELIVVIIIVGILAAVGISQYGKTVERSRQAEAKMIVGNIRKLAYEYYLQNGSLAGATLDDLNIGGASEQIPSGCRSTHYFRYWTNNTDPVAAILAIRCDSGGKSPQYSPSYTIGVESNVATGAVTWYCGADVGWGGGACP